MTLAASAPPPGDEPPGTFSPDDVQHVWLPTHRSLCDLASQVFEDDDNAEAINALARELPVCAPCEIVVGMLDRRLVALQAAGTGSSPADLGDAIALLGLTRWTWMSTDLR